MPSGEATPDRDPRHPPALAHGGIAAAHATATQTPSLRTMLTCAAAAIVVTLAAFWPVCLGGASLMASLAPRDAASIAGATDESLTLFAAQLRERGEAPTWNPHHGLGVPLDGSGLTNLHSPLRAIVHQVPDRPWAFDLTYLLRLLVAATGAACLAAWLGAAAAGSIAAGAAFGLSSYFARQLQMPQLDVEVWLPWLWLTADLLARRASLASLLGYGFVVYAVAAGGHTQPILIAGTATLLFGATRLNTWHRSGFLRVVAAAVPPVLLASTPWLAAIEYLGGLLPHASDTTGATAAVGFLVPAPFGEGNPAPVRLAPYVGLLPLLAALVGFRRASLSLLHVLLWSIAVFGIGATVGLWGVPLLDGALLFPPSALAIALLCACGVDAIERAPPTRRRVLVLLAVTFAVLAWFALGLSLGRRTFEPPTETSSPGSTWTSGLGRIAILAAIFGLVLWRRRTGSRSAAAAGIAAALVVIDLVTAVPTRWHPRADPHAEPSYLQALPRDLPATFRTFGSPGLFGPHRNAAMQIDDLRLPTAPAPARLLGFAHDLWRDPFWAGTARYLDLYNVRYLILSGSQADDVRKTLIREPDSGCKIVHSDPTAVVVERATARPRAFFPERIGFTSGRPGAFDGTPSRGTDRREIVLLASADGPPDGTPVANEAAGGIARIRGRPTAGELEIGVQTTGAGHLVVSVYPFPGLRAELRRRSGRQLRDATSPAVVPADGILSAIAVPKGRSVLRLYYEPTHATLAFWLKIAGAAGLALLAMGTLRKPDLAD